jgi:ATP-dependent Clp protease ATP-binding subunit ClpB
MDFDKFTMKAQEAVQRARQVAIERGHQQIECGHLLKGILEVDEHVLPFIFGKLSIHGPMWSWP